MLLLLSLFVGVAARSAGLFLAAETFGCDFDSNSTLVKLGCQTEQWNKTGGFIDGVTRRVCLDVGGNGGGKVMWWTGKPIKPPPGTWSVRAGDGDPAKDAKTYTPGGYVSIYVRALKFDAMYKGLLMYARRGDSVNGSKVGNWIVPYESAPIFADDTRHVCNRSVMHLSAEDKPYVSKFTFVAPPVGTGKVTIRTMIKTGPPNPTDWGSFYLLDWITLEEGPVEPVEGKWYALPVGQDCAWFCDNHSLPACSESTLSSNLDGMAPFDNAFPCHGAVYHDCTGNPRAELPENFCYYRNLTCGANAVPASCKATSDTTKRLFCACGGIVSPAPRAIPSFVTGALVLLSTWVLGRFRFGGVLFLGLLFAVTPASAHNWIEGTRGRASLLGASQFCTPTFPQLNRNEIHMQVGIMQNFTVEWAAAHTDSTYFVVIHDDDKDKVPLLTRSLMDSWLSMCKTSNFANDTSDAFTKVHRFNTNFNLDSTEPVLTGAATTYADIFQSTPIRSGKIWDAFGGNRSMSFYRPGASGIGGVVTTQAGMNNDLYIIPFNVTNAPSGIIAQYENQYMLNDRRCESSNHNATWIETIVKFSHQEVGRTLAAALLRIQAKKGAGRYQVHYKWASYCDVMDVDVRPTPVPNPYGTPRNVTGGVYTNPFNIGHHCLFETPKYAGQCIEVVTDTQQCQAICNNDGNCKGYQLIPLQLNPSVSGDQWGQFSEHTFIPWLGPKNLNGSRCNISQFENKNIPALGAMLCYPIIQFADDFNAARPLWSFTSDTDHQGFYGTCYLKPRAVDFLPNAQLNETKDVEHRFLDKCIPCDNIGQDLKTPRWGPRQQYCTDCSKYPSPARGLKIPTWTSVGMGTFKQPSHWLSPGGTPYATADECKLLALRDPTCSRFVMWSANRTNLLLRATLNIGATPLFTKSGFGWYYTNNSLAFPYYRSCACLNANPANNVSTFTPDRDATQFTLACEGMTNATCVQRGFEVYKLA